MKKVVCGIFGTIYYATILKDGTMSLSNRVNVTDDAVVAVAQHMLCLKEYEESGYSGYYYKVDGTPINLVAYDASKYKLEPINNRDKSDAK